LAFTAKVGEGGIWITRFARAIGSDIFSFFLYRNEHDEISMTGFFAVLRSAGFRNIKFTGREGTVVDSAREYQQAILGYMHLLPEAAGYVGPNTEKSCRYGGIGLNFQGKDI